jgi:glutamate dehydrogenase (NAD(P)+)
MTLKNAAAGLPHGGGKSIVYGDPKMDKKNKEQLIRAFASALANIEEYIFGPDMGTDEECMAWVKDEIGQAVGLPRELGGVPLDEIGATGWGLRHATEVALDYCNFGLKGARLVVQGYGAVGRHAARFLTQEGAILVGAADSQGTIYNPRGLDHAALSELKQQGLSVIEYPHGERLDRDDVVGIECEIWVPAARPDVIDERNVDHLKAKLVVQGANIPITRGAEKRLHERGVLCVPDFIANAGGVICAAMEYQGASEQAAFQSIEEKLRRNTREVLETSKRRQQLPRVAAVNFARERVQKAMSVRRWSLSYLA